MRAFLYALFVVAFVSGAHGAEVYDPSKATATIAGKVLFEGSAPAAEKLPLTPECVQAHGVPAMDESIKVNANGTLQHVIVYVKSGAEKWTFAQPARETVLDQKGCSYVPHIVTVPVKQKLTILNSDSFLHNVHIQPKSPGNDAFNQGLPMKGMKFDHTFHAPEIISVKCDVHRWMSATIAVTDHPFYTVTGADGAFTLKLPPGNYTIEAWHEKLSPQAQKITIGDNESKEVIFQFVIK